MNELEHSGIKGQRWGQRNGPPYPLKASAHSASEKKAGTKGWAFKPHQDNKKKVSEMSDDELRKNIERKRLEKRYTDLKKGDGTVYDAASRLTNTAGELARTKFGKKSSQATALNKLGNLESKAKDASDKIKAFEKEDISKLSNEELKRRSDRMQLEKDYKDLNPTKIQNGMKTVATIAETVTTLYVLSKTMPAVIKSGKEFVGNATLATLDLALKLLS